MKILLITPEKETANETVIVHDLFAAGLERLHIRKPSFSEWEYRAYIKAIDVVYHNRLVVHGAFELYDEMHLGGVHLDSMMRNDAAVWDKISQVPAQAISTSFHSWNEILGNEFHYGYAFISPVFDSISKQGYTAAIDLAGAKKIKQALADCNKYCPEIIGLGGVGEWQIKTLHDNGFDGAALLGAIWMSSDPVKEFMQILLAAKSL